MPYLSIYRGIVADRKDPEKRGRLMLKVPFVFGDDLHEYWAMPFGLFSGNGTGLMAIPQVGENVWVQFEGGDPRFPVWGYGPWQKDNGLQAAYDSDGEPTKVLLKTNSGQLIVIDDTANTIELIQSDGSKIRLDKDAISLVHDKAISQGSENASAQPGVLGNTNEEVLNGLRDAINDLAQAFMQDITASVGQPYLVLPTSSTAKLPLVLASLVNIKAQIGQTKSNKVTLD